MKRILLDKFNSLRKEKLFNAPLYQTQKKYAFIGVGNHSLANLYPLIQHFGIQLKYICTKSSSWSKQLGPSFPGCLFTNDISDILNDNQIEGVFVCAHPEAHFEIITQLLQAKKNILVEKPPCQNISQLNELIQLSQPASVCKVGLQRRYWPGNKFVYKSKGKSRSYSYHFHFGSYPQGDPYTELFIHALDYCAHLFGEHALKSASKHEDATGITIQIHTQHPGNISGLIELSTHFSWNAPTDKLQINSSTELLKVQYPILVEGTLKPKRLLNIPTERLLHQPLVNKVYFTTGDLVVPAIDLNTLTLQGFYHELETFIILTEGLQGANNIVKNDLPGLATTYSMIEQLRAL